MAKTNADYQREHRQRQSDRIAELETTVSAQAAELAGAKTEIGRMKQERERLYAMLEEVSAAPQDTGPQASGCPHPAHLVDGDRCLGCGQVVDSW